ncbi:sigma 54-interacting transcriptional regulator [Fluviispira multicolorata]|uniref:AAA domain-containing protein n=1 Tax=Fluviispira multicolorata TaxID=2654512 RepID=A0A833JG83_9BACT|nr:sigma 54-interacting transcriptional regulator [Fluviispira multicolorata]KAB8032006.1 AAA domain-containing protein [Fluviispira multicolorata]
MNGSYALMGSSAIIRHVQHLVYKVAESNSAILITGEPGTGKDAIAKIIHERSQRNKFPFVPIKCSAGNEELLEIELFGYESGYVPQSPQAREGHFRQAEGGTLYLDEVSKLSDKLQLALYRAISDGIIRSLGGKADIPINIRIICSTSVDLEQLVRRGLFREELFYKLSATSIYLPPIRERREDIPILAEFFVQKFNQIKAKKIIGISHDAMNALLQNTWANNIQELENLIERIVVLKNSGSIEISDLPPRLRNFVTDNIDAFYDRTQQPIMNQNNIMQTTGNLYHSPTQSNISQYAKLGSQNSQVPPYSQSQRENAILNGHNNHFNRNNQANSPANNNYTQASQPQQNYNQTYSQAQNNLQNSNQSISRNSMFDDIPSEIDQFIKKEIDLGSGIDFYRVVEEFENRLISEALRRTNHNKNRAAQLLSMNRTTLVEKLKKRATTSPIKSETGRVKRNSAFTIFDGLGNDNPDFDTIDFVNLATEEGV